MNLLGSLICSCYILSGINGITVKPGTISGETHCNLASPALDGHGEKFTVLLDHDTAEQIPASAGVWVGYVRDYVVLQITGCLDISDIHGGSVATITNVTNPFYCETLCYEYEYFGLTVLDKTSVTCTCIRDNLTNVNKTKHGCGNACLPSRNTSIVCGSQGFLSLYERVSGNMYKDKPGCSEAECNCLFYSTYAHIPALYWAPCTMYNLRACESSIMGTIAETKSHWINWTTAVGECFQYNYYIIPYHESSRIEQAGNWWTGVIRGKTIYRIQDINLASPSMEYGYIERDTSKLYLHFTKDTTTFNMSLCNRSPQASTTGDGVYVGLSVAVVIVVVAVVGGFCFWTRRKKYNRKSAYASHKKLHDRHTGHNGEDPRISKGMTNVTYNTDIHVSIIAGDERRDTASENKTGTSHITESHYPVTERVKRDTPASDRHTTDSSAIDRHYFILNKLQDTPMLGKRTMDISDVDPHDAVPENVSKETAVSDKQTIDGNAVGPHYFILDKLPDTKHAPDRNTGGETEDDTYNIIADEINMGSDQYDSIVQLQDSGTSDDYDHIGPKTQTRNKGETHNQYDTTSALRENITDDTYDSTATRNVGNKVQVFHGDYYDSTAEHVNGTMDDGYDTTANIRTVVSDGHYDTMSGLRDDDGYDTCATPKRTITETSDDDYSNV